MKNIRDLLSENFQFLEVKISIYLNRHVFVMRNNILVRLMTLPISDCNVDYKKTSKNVDLILLYLSVLQKLTR